jgi:hypothetical protein
VSCLLKDHWSVDGRLTGARVETDQSGNDPVTLSQGGWPSRLLGPGETEEKS